MFRHPSRLSAQELVVQIHAPQCGKNQARFGVTAGGERSGKNHPSQAVSLVSALVQQKGNVQLKLILSF